MRGTKNRNIKILGAAWLVLGGLFLALARIHRRTPMDGVRTAEGGG